MKLFFKVTKIIEELSTIKIAIRYQNILRILLLHFEESQVSCNESGSSRSLNLFPSCQLWPRGLQIKIRQDSRLMIHALEMFYLKIIMSVAALRRSHFKRYTSYSAQCKQVSCLTPFLDVQCFVIMAELIKLSFICFIVQGIS